MNTQLNPRKKNRRITRGHVLDVKLRTKEVRAARVRLATAAVGLVMGTIVGLYMLWRAGDWALDEFVFTNDAFAIRRLDIQTDGVIPVEQLREWAGVPRGDNLLALDLARVKRDLELAPTVESAAVERVLPHTLRIRVAEREPIARVRVPQLKPGGGFEVVSYYLDAAGYVIKPLPARRVPTSRGVDAMPELRGVNASDLRPGNTITDANILAALQLIAAFERSPMTGLVDVESVDVTGTDVLQVVTEQGGHVTLALDHLTDQLRRWRLVYDYGRRQGKAIYTLDLSVANNVPVVWLDGGAMPASTPGFSKPSRNRKKHV